LSVLDKIAQFRATFAATHYWEDMRLTVENSPWHREENVAVHTDMVVDQFLNRVKTGNHDWEHIQTCFDDTGFVGSDKAVATVFLALLFHDTGKPIAKEWNESPERGRYARFGGHEQVSARIWEHYVTTNWSQMTKLFDLKPIDIYRIGWMIENHLSYDLKDAKLDTLVDTIINLFQFDPDFGNTTAFFEMVRADAWGRISDDHDSKKAKSLDWIGMTKMMVEDAVSVIKWTGEENSKLGCSDNDKPVLYLLIGASGSGKSSFIEQNFDMAVTDYYSWDALRLKMALEAGIIREGGDPVTSYSKAWEYANENGFAQYAQKAFSALIRGRRSIVVDNTNTSRKSRRSFVTEAKAHGYRVVSVLFPIDLGTLLARQKSRTDKCVPASAVQMHYAKVCYPMFGHESDEVIVHDGNLKTGWNTDRRYWKRVV
jgi:predicted kinase